ncbi:MAG: uroporphyrinogen-III synthase [Chloroflexota bacterium]
MKVLITRPRSQADSFAEALAAAGFEPVFFPVIEIRPLIKNAALDRAIEKLDRYDWVVFTSVNGVEAFFDAIARERSDRSNLPFDKGIASPTLRSGQAPLARNDTFPKTAAIGPKTAQALEARGVTPDFVPGEYVAEAILPGLGDLRGRRVLLPRAEIARKALPEAITAAGGVAHEIAVYRTLPAIPDPAGLAALKSGVGAVTFTSPSTVANFVRVARRAGLDPLRLPGNPRIACIGPITREAAVEAGFTDVIAAEEYTTEGLVEVLRARDA